jgi:hypothetical protein
MQIRKRLKLDKPESVFEKSLDTELLSAWQELSELINGGLKFEDNHNCYKIRVNDTGAADTEFKVAHTLKRTPDGFIEILNSKAGITYKGPTAWDENFIYLKCSQANSDITIIII